ncbi:MAG: hypothetical protein MJY68_07070 [Bacteroidaceae bacterium]|nr:hypothetical protein [Bacteroidaceae bacterium]
MRTFRKLLVPVMVTLAVGLASCTNDYEMWDEANETETWEFELRNIVSDLDFLFENSFVKFQQAEELNYKVDSLDFFSDDTYYPVCVKKLYNFFMLKKLDFLENDTNTIHLPSFAIKGIVSNIINNQEKYDIVKLTWSYDDERFTTLAAFDKTNGQIVYDNILTNIPLFQTEIPSRKSKLTRSEGGYGDIETRVFYKDRLTVEHEGYYFDYRIKGLCKVCKTGDGVYSLVEFESIESQCSAPDYPHGMFYPAADVVIASGCIIYYLWIGEDGKRFSSYYSSDNPAVNAYNIWYDVHHNNKHGKCDAESAGFYYNLNSGLYAPDLGWNF